MKKIFALLLVSCLLAMVCALPASATNQGKYYIAPYGAPAVDGVMDDVWYLAPWEKTTTGNPGSIFARFKVLHDDTYVYFLFQYTDPEPSQKQKECIQLALHEDRCDLGWDGGCSLYSVHFLQCNGTLWCQIDPESAGNGKSVMCGDYRVENEGDTFTLEISLKLDRGIPTDDGIFMEVIMEDYTADGKWIKPRSWNADGAKHMDMDDFGMLYFLPDEGAEIPTGEIYEETPDPEVITTPAFIEEAPVANAPTQNEPQETEPKESEPQETAPKETEPQETKSEESKPTAAPVAKGAASVAAVVIFIVVVAIITAVLTKKKKRS